eukprot:TRINITY_DN37066_c0_g1_i2.p2 TRINITY_DN37066_c0_g1~~TRINITY_DN37066_c0_g1_i2.p2  ORF type:complete len:174 (+),score=48.25 TRINITY_DN37066_c0_g1_i2:60-524(+)
MNWKNSKISEVAKENIWKEHVKNESQYRNSKESFSINPYRLDKTKPICENIASRPKRFLAKELYTGDETKLTKNETGADLSENELARREKTTGDIKQCLLSVHKTPIDKYPIPQTESQEIGWLSRPLVPTQSEFQHALRSCDITKFANDLALTR